MNRFLVGVLVYCIWGSSAWALDGTALEINMLNGAVGIVDPLDETKGGTGTGTFATGDIIYSDATDSLARLTFVATATRYLANTGGAATIPAWNQVNLANGVTGTLPILNGGTNATSFTTARCVRFDGTSLVSHTTDCAVSTAPITHFTTLGTITASQTVFATFANVSATENNVETAVSAASFANMRCESNTAISAGSVTITGRKGTCGTLADDVDVQVILSASETGDSDLTGVLDLTAGQCMAFSIVTAAATPTATINCSIERTG